ncbi:MAG: hypothetical protein IPN24_20105 [Betaproteobacteria bacterium]|nr:hypothetical protein [Betaproteobacteria bacterium]
MRGRIVCSLLALFSAASAADESPVGISGVETPDVKLYYYDYLGNIAPLAIRTFTNAREWQRRVFGWSPSEPTTVLLQDFADYGNALAYAAPRGTLIIDVAPLSRAFETSPASERMYSTMNHELVHVVQSDIANDEDRRWRKFFSGKVPANSKNPETLLYSYLTIPRFTAPRWYSEGGAVFLETWMAGGLGRAQGGYDEMVFRTMVRDDAHFYDPLGLASRGTKVDFQTGANAYLYGGRFFTWLAWAHSPQKVVAWIRRDEGSARYYADQFEQVFGMPLDRAWQDWIAFEREFQRRNLAEVRKFPTTTQTKLANRALGSVSRLHYDEATRTLYGAFRYPGVVEHVGALDTRDGTVRQLADIKGAMHYMVASFAYDPGSGTAFYTENNTALRDLKAVDVKTGEVRTLLEQASIGEIVFNPADRSLLGVRHLYGLATLVRIPYPYTEWKEIHTFPWEHVPSDLDISRDGRLLSASISDDKGDQFLRVWRLEALLAGDVTPLREYGFGQSVPESFVFSPDGRYLYGSSYYTGVSNIFRYEIATGEIEAVSNAESGFFRPVPLPDGRLAVLAYTGEGFVPAIIEARPIKDVSAIRFLGAAVAEKYPEVKSWQVPGPATVDDEKLVTKKGPYRPLANLELVNAFPVVQGYKSSAAIGYRFNFEDPLQFTSLAVTTAYSPWTDLPGNERGHVEIAGRYEFWRAALSWNRADFYDLFGPTKRGRKGYAAKLGYDLPLIYDKPRRLDLNVDFAFYDQIDTLPNAQNVSTGFTRLITSEVGLHYTDLRRSLGAVDDEKGTNWSLVYNGNHVNGALTPQFHGQLDLGFALPLEHASIWLRTAGGIANGERSSTVANFYFGGFGNNYVDDKAIKRYREFGSFPGFAIDEISTQKFVRELVEFNAPPHVFESAGTPGLHLRWLRPSLFAAGLWSDPGNQVLRSGYASFGGQADLHFSILHRYDMTLSVGYAVGYSGTQRSGSEWMVSLKIM